VEFEGRGVDIGSTTANTIPGNPAPLPTSTTSPAVDHPVDNRQRRESRKCFLAISTGVTTVVRPARSFHSRTRLANLANVGICLVSEPSPRRPSPASSSLSNVPEEELTS